MRETVFPAIRNWPYSPPAGGWSLTLEVNGFSRHLSGAGPFEILAGAMLFAKQVKYDPEPFEIEAILNGEWTRRDPSRAIPTMPPPKPKGARSRTSTAPRHVPPREWGRSVWLYLNTFGMPGSFDPSHWMATITRIANLLNPTHNPRTGCAECFTEWMDILRDSPPEKTTNENLAAKWVWSAHNRVNKKLGKKEISWDSAAEQNGWNY